MDLLVPRVRGGERRPIWGERRGVGDDHAEWCAGTLEPAQLVEDVRGLDLGAGCQAVERQVAASGCDRLRRGLDADGATRPAPKRVAGESRRVAERVEDVAAGGEAGDPRTVLSLVEVE